MKNIRTNTATAVVTATDPTTTGGRPTTIRSGVLYLI